MATTMTDLRTSILCPAQLSGQSACKLFSPGLPAALCSDAKPNWFGCGVLCHTSLTAFYGVLKNQAYCVQQRDPFVAKVLPCLRGQSSLCSHSVIRALHPSGLTSLLENALPDFPVSLLSLLITVQQEDVAERGGRPETVQLNVPVSVITAWMNSWCDTHIKQMFDLPLLASTRD